MKNTIIVIILLALGFGVYAYFNNKNKDVEAPANIENNEASNTEDTNETQAESNPTIKANLDVSVSTNVKEFTVSGKNFSFTPSKISVKKGDTVKITFKNSDGFHDFRIDEYNVATKQIASGAQETMTFVANKTGSFVYYCSVGKHRANGMWGTLTVE